MPHEIATRVWAMYQTLPLLQRAAVEQPRIHPLLLPRDESERQRRINR